ncbi:MAG: transporter substrate-binding domain-containing protein [Myxococcota bacterium]
MPLGPVARLALTLLLLLATAARAQEPEPEPAAAPPAALRVAVSELPPFVSLGGERPKGFSIDLWQAVAREVGLRYELVPYPDVGAKLAAVASGEADVAIGGISITLERERTLDFTLPVFRTGLDILVADVSGPSMAALPRLFTPARVGIVLGFLALIVVSGHLVWYAERGADAFDDRYIPGVFEGMYWAIVTASTVGYGDKAPVRWPGRLVAAAVIVVSLPMFAVFTAELASTLTVASIEGDISGPDDLRGRRVGVRAGTTAVDAVRELGGDVVVIDSLDAGIDAVAAGRLDALVHDAPTLDWLAQHDDRGVHTVGRIFDPQRYGFALAADSPHREAIGLALLAVRERGEWARIRDLWFTGDVGE